MIKNNRGATVKYFHDSVKSLLFFTVSSDFRGVKKLLYKIIWIEIVMKPNMAQNQPRSYYYVVNGLGSG